MHLTAVSKQQYADLISGSGFEMIETHDHSEALTDTIEKVRRRLSLLEIAAGVGELRLDELGVTSDLCEHARRIAAALIEEGRKGLLGYMSFAAVNS